MNTTVRATNLSLRHSHLKIIKQGLHKGKKIVVFDRLAMLGNSPRIKYKQYHYSPQNVAMLLRTNAHIPKAKQQKMTKLFRNKDTRAVIASNEVVISDKE